MRLQFLPLFTCIFCILLLSGIAVAQVYYVPPVGQVLDDNSLPSLADNLGNQYDNTTAIHDWVNISFYGPVSVNGSVNLAGLSLMLDNGTYPADGLRVLVARGAQMGRIMSRPLSGIPAPCTLEFFAGNTNDLDVISCDFENPRDGCPEYERELSAVYDAIVTFSFRNRTVEVTDDNGTAVPVPQEMLDAMKSSSGAEQLNVTVRGLIKFTYYVTDEEPYGDGCSDANSYNVTKNVSFSTSRNFTVYGTNKLFFLRAPVLREQWFRNNRFDVVVFSQAPLYHADIYLNGNRTRNITLRTFEINSSSYGVQEIISSLSSPDGWSEAANLSTPTPLEAGNLSFAYIYAFNYSYEGIGQNNLSLVVTDSFLGPARYGEQLLSRMLSYNGTGTENGSIMPPGQVRPSAAFEPDYLASVELVLGLLALLFLLSFVNLWLLK